MRPSRRMLAPLLCLLMTAAPFVGAAAPPDLPPVDLPSLPDPPPQPPLPPLGGEGAVQPGADGLADIGPGLAGACDLVRPGLYAGPVVAWTSCNMGPGSGLDADRMDGLDSARFVQYAPNGNVGIGTTTAVERLQVDGNIRLDNDARLSWAPSSEATDTYITASRGGSYIRFFQGGTQTVELSQNPPNAALSVRGATANSGAAAFEAHNSAAASLLYVRNDGNVGIGTTAPAAKLDVAGDVKMSGAGNGLVFPDGTKQTTAAGPAGEAETVMIMEEQFDKTYLWGGWTVSTTGNGRIHFENPGIASWDTVYPGGPDSATLRSNRAFSVNDGTLVFKATLAAYQEGCCIYGNGQPRGLAAGTDRNNAIEFITAAPNTVACRTVSGGVATQTNVNLGATVYDQHAYQIVAKPAQVRFYVDGSLACTHTTNIPPTALNLLFSSTDGGFGNVPIYLDSATFEIQR